MKDDAFKALQELSVIALGEGTEAQSVYTRQLTDTIRAALTPSPVSVDAKAGEVCELVKLLDILIDKSGKYHDALGYGCEDPDNNDAAIKSWSESREVALVNVQDWLRKNRQALTAPKKDSKPVSGEVSRLALALFALRDLRSCCNLPSDNAFKKSCIEKADKVLANEAAQQPAEDESFDREYPIINNGAQISEMVGEDALFKIVADTFIDEDSYRAGIIRETISEIALHYPNGIKIVKDKA